MKAFSSIAVSSGVLFLLLGLTTCSPSPTGPASVLASRQKVATTTGKVLLVPDAAGLLSEAQTANISQIEVTISGHTYILKDAKQIESLVFGNISKPSVDSKKYDTLAKVFLKVKPSYKVATSFPIDSNVVNLQKYQFLKTK